MVVWQGFPGQDGTPPRQQTLCRACEMVLGGVARLGFHQRAARTPMLGEEEECGVEWMEE